MLGVLLLGGMLEVLLLREMLDVLLLGAMVELLLLRGMLGVLFVRGTLAVVVVLGGAALPALPSHQQRLQSPVYLPRATRDLNFNHSAKAGSTVEERRFIAA
jgi:hypothetical protein